MEEMLNYTLKASIGLLVLYGLYFVLLRRHNHFAFSRLYLLLAPPLALLLPLLSWPAALYPSAVLEQGLQTLQLSQVTVTAYRPEAGGATPIFTVAQVGLVVYTCGVLFVLLRLLRQLWLLEQTKITATLYSIAGKAKVYQLNGSYPTFAFGRSIFLSGQQAQLSEEAQQQVLAHELAHVQQGHTLDVLLYELYSAVLWFHPAVWLLKQELRDVHEFQADAQVVEQHQAQAYASLLSREALLSMGLPVGSHFTKPQVIKRLRMLQQRHQKSSWLRPVLLLPIVGGLALALARPQAAALPPDTSTNEKPYTYVEQMPQFEGGETAMLQFLGKNIRYPKQAQEQGIEGLAVVTFVVGTDGTLSEIAMVKPLTAEMNAEALRVVQLMQGKWQPGRQNGKKVPVRYTLPIRFAIR